MHLRQIVLSYLAVTHCILWASSPSYSHELWRGCRAVFDTVQNAKWHAAQRSVRANNTTQGAADIAAALKQLPTSGVYASTDLLHSIQRHMTLHTPATAAGGTGHNATSPPSSSTTTTTTTTTSSSAALLYTTSSRSPLVAYTSASDVIQGEGWGARAAFFVYLLAPRYLLAVSPHATLGLGPQYDLFYLAGQDLPAVGLMRDSEEPAVGYELSCTSPALSMGLGPQPLANCSVWLVEPPPAHADAPTLSAQRLQHLYHTRAAAAAVRTQRVADAAFSAAASHASNDSSSNVNGSSDASTSTSGSSDNDDAAEHRDSQQPVCPARRQVATWIVLPDSSPEGVAQQLKDIGAEPQPFLSGPTFGSEGGDWLSSLLDVWLFFPRAGLLKLLPAMSGVQRLQYGYAVLAISYRDLLQLAQSVMQLQANAVNGGRAVLGAMLGIGAWGYLMMGLSVVLQLLLMTTVRAVLAACAAHLSMFGLLLVVRGMYASMMLRVPMLRLLGCFLHPRVTAVSAGAAVLTFAAVVRLRDVACLLLWAVLCMLLLGLLFGFLTDVRQWDEDPAALLSMACVGLTFGTGVYWYCSQWGPALVLPAGAASSRSWLTRLAARATAKAAASSAATVTTTATAAGGSTASAAAAVGAASAAAAAAPATASSVSALVFKTSVTLRGLLKPWHGALLSLRSMCEDWLMLTAAMSLWRLLVPAGDALWRGCVEVATEAGVVLECLGSAVVLLLAGVGWREVWGRFWLSVQQRLPHHRHLGGPLGGMMGMFGAAAAGAGGNAQMMAALHGAGAMGGGMGANGPVHALVIHAQQAQPLPDMAETADALRQLADELENMDGQAPMFVNGRLVVPAGGNNRGPKLGSHWPPPLQINLDMDEVRDELGVEVPRGMVCPLTLDIMTQPALLISSNVAVPSSYEKEAITRWLQENRPPRDPKSRRIASDAQLVPNFDLYRSIDHWVSDTRALLMRHRQRLQAQAQLAAAQAAGAAAAAPGLGARHQQQQQQQPASSSGAAAAAAAGPQRSGSVGSMLAAARGAVVRGTAAAAVAAAAAAAAAMSSGQGRRARGAAAAAAAGRGGHASDDEADPYAFPTDDDDDDAADAADAAADGGGIGGVSDDDDELMLLDDDHSDDLDADAVHSPPAAAAAAAPGRTRGATPQRPTAQPPPGGPAAAAGAAGNATSLRASTPREAAAAAGQGSGGRYNLRQRRPSPAQP